MMKNLTKLAALLLACATAQGQTIIADNYNAPNVAASGTDMLLGEGVNSGINPPITTRLTGTAADGLRYINRAAKPATSFLLGGDVRLRVNSGASNGRVTLSADGLNPFDFGPALGVGAATPANPIQYDITISMDNNASGIQRFSFALGTAETDANGWDFGLQLHRAVATDSFYTVSGRMDIGSTGLGSDYNQPILSNAGTAGTELDFLIRVTDAGAESSTFNSRVQVSMDGGSSWFYDTSADPLLLNEWRLDGAGRYFSWDVAGGNSSFVTYDNFSVTLLPAIPEPSVVTLGLLAGLVGWIWRRR